MCLATSDVVVLLRPTCPLPHGAPFACVLPQDTELTHESNRLDALLGQDNPRHFHWGLKAEIRRYLEVAYIFGENGVS
jgi:hypothetical protein